MGEKEAESEVGTAPRAEDEETHHSHSHHHHVDEVVLNPSCIIATNVDEDENYPVGNRDFKECSVCYEYYWLYRRPCCDFPVCTPCLTSYYQVKIESGVVTIECINPECHTFVHRDEIASRLDPDTKAIYYKLLYANNCDELCKTCPRCNHVFCFGSEDALKCIKRSAKTVSTISRVQCSDCQCFWCFLCHAPWHTGITCKQYRKGDRLLQLWAKQIAHGQVNAQRCPKCKIFIQRSSGCDHMHCNRCKTDFCYRCGDKLRRLKFFGDHYSKLSIFGCKYRYKPNSPVQRKVIRGAVFGTKVVLAPVLGSLAVCAGALLVGVGVTALPLFGAIRLYQVIQTKKGRKLKKKLTATSVEDLQKKIENLLH